MDDNEALVDAADALVAIRKEVLAMTSGCLNDVKERKALALQAAAAAQKEMADVIDTSAYIGAKSARQKRAEGQTRRHAINKVVSKLTAGGYGKKHAQLFSAAYMDMDKLDVQGIPMVAFDPTECAIYAPGSDIAAKFGELEAGVEQDLKTVKDELLLAMQAKPKWGGATRSLSTPSHCTFSWAGIHALVTEKSVLGTEF